MKLNRLERLLENLEGFSDPSPLLEQYRTPAPLAARLLFHAALKGDIEGKRVCDLGCGTGILAIGASLLGAREVVAVDIDQSALADCPPECGRAEVDILFLHADSRDPATPGRSETAILS